MLLKQSQSWEANVSCPSFYRMGLAHLVSAEGRRVFERRWRGLYVGGSTASLMASHLKDVDVFPLIESPADEREKEQDLDLIRALNRYVDRLERETGVFVEIWVNKRGDCASPVWYLRDFENGGAESIIESEGILLAEGSLDMPDRIRRPERAAKYAAMGSDLNIDPPGWFASATILERYPNLRGEDERSAAERLEFEEEWAKVRREYYILLKEILPQLSLGELKPWIAAFAILNDHVIWQYGLYNRLEFLVTNEKEAQAILGFIPTEKTMMQKLYELGKILYPEEGEWLREKLRRLNSFMRLHGFEGVSSNLTRDFRRENEELRRGLGKTGETKTDPATAVIT